MEKEIGSETEMEEGTGGRRKGKEKKRKTKTGNEGGNGGGGKLRRVSTSLLALWSFIPVLKVHTRSITAAGTII